MTTYQYDAWIYDEIKQTIRGLFGAGVHLAQASRAEDVGGIDACLTVNHRAQVQLRVRFDRPLYAPDDDIAFRLTEPAMIAAKTYAPLMLYFWMKGRRIVAGKCVDVYRMADGIVPPLADRPCIMANDGNGGLRTVRIEELYASRSILAFYDGIHWAFPLTNADVRFAVITSGDPDDLPLPV